MQIKVRLAGDGTKRQNGWAVGAISVGLLGAWRRDAGFAYIPQAAVGLASPTLRIPGARMRASLLKQKAPYGAFLILAGDGDSNLRPNTMTGKDYIDLKNSFTRFFTLRTQVPPVD